MPAPACESFSLLVRDGVRLRRVRGLLAVNRHGRVLWRERRFSSRWVICSGNVAGRCATDAFLLVLLAWRASVFAASSGRCEGCGLQAVGELPLAKRAEDPGFGLVEGEFGRLRSAASMTSGARSCTGA